jgi:hypothetical protein
MKLSEATVNVLKSFSTINGSIEFKPGNIVSTISPQKNILAKATVDDTFPSAGAIHNLNRFLGALTLFNDPALQFQEKFVTIKDSKSSLNYGFADSSMIVTPPDKELKQNPVELSVTLKSSDLIGVLKSAAVLQLPEIRLWSDGSSIELQAYSSKNPTADTFSTIVDSNSTGKKFSIVFKVENVKLMNYDYQVDLSQGTPPVFTSVNQHGPKVKYWIAAESTSTFFE